MLCHAQGPKKLAALVRETYSDNQPCLPLPIAHLLALWLAAIGAARPWEVSRSLVTKTWTSYLIKGLGQPEDEEPDDSKAQVVPFFGRPVNDSFP